MFRFVLFLMMCFEDRAIGNTHIYLVLTGFLPTLFTLNCSNCQCVATVKRLLWKLETETNFRILQIYYYYYFFGIKNVTCRVLPTLFTLNCSNCQCGYYILEYKLIVNVHFTYLNDLYIKLC
jgi:hypothetical protein